MIFESADGNTECVAFDATHLIVYDFVELSPHPNLDIRKGAREHI